MDYDSGVFWNESKHWMTHGGEFICFDTKNECFKEMQCLPYVGREVGGLRCLKESNGHLNLIEVVVDHSSHFKVFEVERDYSTWFIKYDICLDVIFATYPGAGTNFIDVNYYEFAPNFVVQGQNGGDDSLLMHFPGNILSLNVRDQTFEQLFDFDAAYGTPSSSGLQFGFQHAFPHFQSLVPV